MAQPFPPFHDFELDLVFLRLCDDIHLVFIEYVGQILVFRRGRHADGREDHAPPVFSGALADGDPHRVVHARRQGARVVGAGGKVHPGQFGVYRIVIAFVIHPLLSRRQESRKLVFRNLQRLARVAGRVE